MEWFPVAISALALLVSVAALWHTLSARPAVRAEVERFHRIEQGQEQEQRPVRDQVNVYNVGRAPAIILKVGAVDASGIFTTPRSMAIAGSEDVPFLALPLSLEPQVVVHATFSVLGNPDDGLTYGYGVIYLRARIIGQPRRAHFIVKTHPSDEKRPG